jgi:hypothetical protein
LRNIFICYLNRDAPRSAITYGQIKQTSIPLVTISIDFGGSGTKVVVQIRGGKPKVIWMEPGVIKANYESLVFQTRNLNNAYPENAAKVLNKASSYLRGFNLCVAP